MKTEDVSLILLFRSSMALIWRHLCAIQSIAAANALLKQENEPDNTLISLFEEEMAEQGTIVYQKRLAFVEDFIPVFQQILSADIWRKRNR